MIGSIKHFVSKNWIVLLLSLSLIVAFFTLQGGYGKVLVTAYWFSITVFLLFSVGSFLLCRTNKTPKPWVALYYLFLCVFPYLGFVVIEVFLGSAMNSSKELFDVCVKYAYIFLGFSGSILPWSLFLLYCMLSAKVHYTASVLYTVLGGFASLLFCVVTQFIGRFIPPPLPSATYPTWSAAPLESIGQHAVQTWIKSFWGLVLCVVCMLAYGIVQTKLKGVLKDEKKY